MENLSRREFFQKLIPNPEKLSDAPLLPKLVNEVAQFPTLSRRSFIKFLRAAGAALALEQVGVKINEIQGDPKKEQMEIKNEEEENSYTETIIGQSLMTVANILAISIFKKLEIECGNPSLSDEKLLEWLKEKPIEGIIKGGILDPACEEALFRALPSRFLDKSDRSHRWEIGIPVSVLFALMHNIGEDKFEGLKFHKSVPICQFTGGLFFWYLMREKGYSHAVLAHSIGNTIPLSIGMLLYRIYSE